MLRSSFSDAMAAAPSAPPTKSSYIVVADRIADSTHSAPPSGQARALSMSSSLHWLRFKSRVTGNRSHITIVGVSMFRPPIEKARQGQCKANDNAVTDGHIGMRPVPRGLETRAAGVHRQHHFQSSTQRRGQSLSSHFPRQGGHLFSPTNRLCGCQYRNIVVDPSCHRLLKFDLDSSEYLPRFREKSGLKLHLCL